MLTIDSVQLEFEGREIISGCYLSVEKGEIVGLLGRNGCGKSNLLKIIFGSLKANFSHLRIDGKLVDKGFATHKVSYLPQDHFLPPFIRVREIVHTIDDTDEIFTDILDKRLNEISTGTLRFLECLWILNSEAPYLLLDEPFSGLSPLFIEKLQAVILKKRASKGIVLTDHIYRALLQISDRVVLMHNNSIYAIHSEQDLVLHQYIPE